MLSLGTVPPQGRTQLPEFGGLNINLPLKERAGGDSVLFTSEGVFFFFLTKTFLSEYSTQWIFGKNEKHRHKSLTTNKMGESNYITDKHSLSR